MSTQACFDDILLVLCAYIISNVSTMFSEKSAVSFKVTVCFICSPVAITSE